MPAWATSLPPEIRDPLLQGDFGRIPARYRDLVRRYLLWLNHQPTSAHR